jgi:IrrE N-terminal-like domain
MTDRYQLPTIQDAIAALYEMAELLPSADRLVTPLGELISNYNLTCTEIAGLTSRSAINLLLQRGGLTEPTVDLSNDSLAGFLYVSPSFGSIFVERDDFLVRRRFSAAHELGHYLLHFRPLLYAARTGNEPVLIEAMDALPLPESDLEPDVLPASKITLSETSNYGRLLPPIEQMEREANEFAAELLMPETVVRALTDRHTADLRGEDLIWRMATDMLVSVAAMRWRFRNLGLLRVEQSIVN